MICLDFLKRYLGVLCCGNCLILNCNECELVVLMTYLGCMHANLKKKTILFKKELVPKVHSANLHFQQLHKCGIDTCINV